MQYNAHSMLSEYYTYEELGQMPIRDLMSCLDYFSPKFKEIARRQEEEKIKAELTNKKKSRPRR